MGSGVNKIRTPDHVVMEIQRNVMLGKDKEAMELINNPANSAETLFSQNYNGKTLLQNFIGMKKQEPALALIHKDGITAGQLSQQFSEDGKNRNARDLAFEKGMNEVVKAIDRKLSAGKSLVPNFQTTMPTPITHGKSLK